MQLPDEQSFEPLQVVIGTARQELQHCIASRGRHQKGGRGRQEILLQCPISGNDGLKSRYNRTSNPSHELLIDHAWGKSLATMFWEPA